MNEQTILHDTATCDLCKSGWTHQPIGKFTNAHKINAGETDLRKFAREAVRRFRKARSAHLN